MVNLKLFALTGYQEARTEIVRKSIHFLIAISPGLAVLSKSFAVGLLGAGIFVYSVFEFLRLQGVKIPVISFLTLASSRSRDKGHFVLGPVTLGLGALLSILFFEPVAAAIAVYALAFGDGFAGLVGKLFGRNRPAFMFGKSVEGSAACFFAVFISAFLVSGSINAAILAAAIAATVEVLPLDDFDNLLMPLAVGIVVSFWL